MGDWWVEEALDARGEEIRAGGDDDGEMTPRIAKEVCCWEFGVGAQWFLCRWRVCGRWWCEFVTMCLWRERFQKVFGFEVESVCAAWQCWGGWSDPKERVQPAWMGEWC